MKTRYDKGVLFLSFAIILSVAESVSGGTFSDGTIYTIDQRVKIGTVPLSSSRKIYANLCTIALADNVSDVSLSNQLFYQQGYSGDWYHY